MKNTLLTTVVLLAIFLPAMAQRKPKPAPADLTKPPLDAADMAKLPERMERR